MSHFNRRSDATGDPSDRETGHEQSYGDPADYADPPEYAGASEHREGSDYPALSDERLGDFAYPDPAYAAPVTETHTMVSDPEGEPADGEDAARPSVGDRMTEFRGRITRALSSFDRGYAPRVGLAASASQLPAGEEADETEVATDDERTEMFDVLSEVPPRTGAGRFAVTPLGYNRAAVDEYVAALEHEIAALRGKPAAKPEPAISITEELERIGEQTASILVVAHDKAHETTRIAQEQAEQRLAEAASNAVAMTEEAKRRLEALDMETDTVWQERARLLEDARSTGQALIAMIDEAERRLPDELRPADVEGSPAP